MKRSLPRAARRSACAQAALAALALLSPAVHGQTVTLSAGESQSLASGTLNGDLVFNGSNSSYTVGAGAQIAGNVRVGASGAGITGTLLSFAGGSNFQGSLGSASARLGQVVFNSAGTGQAVQLRSDVWALSTWLGNQSANSTLATVAPLNPLNGAGGLRFGGDLVLVNPATTLDLGATRNTVDGDFKTGGGTLRYVLSPTASASGHVQANRMVLTGGETVVLSLTGSLANGATQDLVSSSNAAQGVYSQDELSGRVQDNSFVIDSSVALSADGQRLVYTATRTGDQYITKSQTDGHYANAAARSLGLIAAQGLQQGDLATVIDRFDLDSGGYGHDQATLATHIRRLAPVANNSQLLSVLGAADASLATQDDRLLHQRGELPGARSARGSRAWARPFTLRAKQTGEDAYDGYSSRTSGVAVGADFALSPQSWWGLVGVLGDTTLRQRDGHAGDRSQIRHGLLGLNAGRELGAWTLVGALSAGRFDLESTRTAPQDRVARASHEMRYASLRGDAYYRIKLSDGKSTLSPTLGFEAAQLKQPGYTETGAGDLGLTVAGKTYNRSRFKAGLRFATQGRLAGRPSYTAFSATVSHDGGLGNLDVAARYSGATDATAASFVTPAAPLNRTSVQLSGALTLALGKNGSLQARYDLDHRLGFLSQGIALTALQKF